MDSEETMMGVGAFLGGPSGAAAGAALTVAIGGATLVAAPIVVAGALLALGIGGGTLAGMYGGAKAGQWAGKEVKNWKVDGAKVGVKGVNPPEPYIEVSFSRDPR